MNTAIIDEMKLLKKQPALLYLIAWDELKVWYSRSILGPFWIVIATGISAFLDLAISGA